MIVGVDFTNRFDKIVVSYMNEIKICTFPNLQLLKQNTFPDSGIGFTSINSDASIYAFTGRPYSTSTFRQSSIAVYDTTNFTKFFENSFPDDILCIKLSKDFILIGFIDRVEIWDFVLHKKLNKVNITATVQYPMGISPDSNLIVLPGPSPSSVYVCSDPKRDITKLQINGEGSFLSTSVQHTDVFAFEKNIIIFDPNIMKISQKIQGEYRAISVSISFENNLAILANKSLKVIGPNSETIFQTEVAKNTYSKCAWMKNDILLYSSTGAIKIITLDNSSYDVKLENIA
ncbi:hypothetical protein TVAG_020630 [Trichomonas vaginalis G3]|uniref:Uncharacterized protein n=1 Tax=Trichomonas vaginalis (strain ATCC PRA-98 / G3) TaxID=412133 RepID=A2EXX7_TRIV3|nr:WD40 repeat-like family [Trichomonas vaginalis G3]EAY02510.1 hypothetical protein TVAG_020630 [Trichomonas vaginalis G3]KAI5529086.1 WD40 repeat-like family [Trichomonas vaginalis G3]|eukprot:XP_001314749.1 hypothetical protein [Trichomonas vaginalis G3]